MHIQAVILSLVAVFCATGCGKGPQTSAQPDNATPPASASADAKSGSARTIEITSNDQMQFSVTAIDAKPGEELRVRLINKGTVPKEAMGHNWVLLKSGTDVMSFAALAASARETQYIPAAQQDKVLAHTDVLGPKQTGEVTFKAPEQPGEYPFLCSFPGHAALMKGVLTVK